MTEIFVHEPGLGKNLMIAFTAITKKDAVIINASIREVMNTDHGMMAYHQIGLGDTPGFHAWEPWRDNVTREELESIIPLIEQRVYLMREIW